MLESDGCERRRAAARTAPTAERGGAVGGSSAADIPAVRYRSVRKRGSSKTVRACVRTQMLVVRRARQDWPAVTLAPPVETSAPPSEASRHPPHQRHFHTRPPHAAGFRRGPFARRPAADRCITRPLLARADSPRRPFVFAALAAADRWCFPFITDRISSSCPYYR